MANRKRIIVLLSFFGKFPWYFDFFIHSCRYNPSITFCIISDNAERVEDTPKNVWFLQKSMEQFQDLATKKLGFPAKLVEGYKICDFRPSLGFLFPELISEYAFWGYGDIDIIYGNLRHFLTEKMLNKYDIISFRPEYLTGSFTVCRNSAKINKLFMESRDYRTVLSRDTYFNFDECNFLFAPLQAGEPIGSLPCEIESMTHVVRRRHDEGYLNAYFDFQLIEGATGNVKWTDGKIIYKNRFEAALYHFLKFKDRCKNKKMPATNGEPFYISENTIYKKYRYRTRTPKHLKT